MTSETLQEWQINEIKKGLAEADAGELVSHETVLREWKKRALKLIEYFYEVAS